VTTSTPTVAVRVAEPGLAQNLRAVSVVLRRELIRFATDRTRMIAMLVQPLLFLFVLGNGLSSVTAASTNGVPYKTFMFPGILATSTLFTAMFASVSVVWDREFGFLREMMVAPVSRTAIIVGKAIGGATVATAQGCIIIALGPLVGVPLSVSLVLTLVVEVFIISFAITAFGLVIAARMQSMQAVMGVMQMIMLPMMMLSGALYPISNLPPWLTVLVKLNPLTYGVYVVRSAVFRHLPIATRVALAPLNQPIIVFGHAVTPAEGIALVLTMGLILLGVAAAEFRRTE
jgi:ABC-2 type transport system permease protein